MTSLFKRFKKNLPISTSKGSVYYRRENIIGNYDDLKKVLEAAPRIPEVKTDVEITFNTIDDVYFHLYYLAGNETTQQLIEQYAGHVPEQEGPTGFKESLDQYI